MTQNYPEPIVEMFTKTSKASREFLKNLRHYNSAFAFASVQSNVDNLSAQGVYSYKINGQIYHHLSQAVPRPGTPARYGQLYFVDVQEALITRQNLNVNLSKDVLKYFEDFFRSNNKYAREYQTMRYVHESELARAQQENRRPLEIVMMFPENNNQTRGKVFNLPVESVVGEIAVIFVEDPEQKFNRHGIVSVRTHQSGFNNIQKDSKHVDPMCYPMLFLFGEQKCIEMTEHMLLLKI